MAGVGWIVGILNRIIKEGFTVKVTVEDLKDSLSNISWDYLCPHSSQTNVGSISSLNESLIKASALVSIEWENSPRIVYQNEFLKGFLVEDVSSRSTLTVFSNRSEGESFLVLRVDILVPIPRSISTISPLSPLYI